MIVILPDTSKLKDYEYPEIAERFYREVAHHELTVLHDDGLYRHLRMKPNRTRSSSYWYEIITWPGNLVFRGDGETYAFSRAQDMFEFFRSGLYKDGSIHINASYWAEKLTSHREASQNFSEKKFSKHVREILRENEGHWPGLTEAWKKATDSFMADYDVSHEHGAYEAIHNFSYGELHYAKCSCGALAEEETQYDLKFWARKNGHQSSFNADLPGHSVKFTRREPFTFEIPDVDFKDYDWWFLWALYGICEAIKAYDDPKSHRRLIKNAAVETLALTGSVL